MKTAITTSRRNFLKSTLAVPVGLTLGRTLQPASASAAPIPGETAGPLPMRRLGKNGPEVTLISLGGMMAALSPDYLDIAWSMGIR